MTEPTTVALSDLQRRNLNLLCEPLRGRVQLSSTELASFVWLATGEELTCRNLARVMRRLARSQPVTGG